MRLSNGFVIDKEKTFELKFTAIVICSCKTRTGYRVHSLKSVSMI